jgi:hypothetical protein
MRRRRGRRPLDSAGGRGRPCRADRAREPGRAARRRRSGDAGLRPRHAYGQRLAHRRGRSDPRRRAGVDRPQARAGVRQPGLREGRDRRRRAGDGQRRREPRAALGPARRRWELRDRHRAGVPPASRGPAGHRGRRGPRLRRCARGPALLRGLRRHRAGRAVAHRLDLPRPGEPPRRPRAPRRARHGPGGLLRRRSGHGRAGPSPVAQLRASARRPRRADALHGPAERLRCGVPERSAQLLEVALRGEGQRRMRWRRSSSTRRA